MHAYTHATLSRADWASSLTNTQDRKGTVPNRTLGKRLGTLGEALEGLET
jgi:hypothetical protein